MLIDDATLTVADPAAAAEFYHEVLALPVVTGPGLARVTVGRSTLTLRRGGSHAGSHHVAFGVAPEDFDAFLDLARQRLAPIAVGDSEVVTGPEGWDSRSVYFLGPEGIVLEYIAHEAHRGRSQATPVGRGSVPGVLALGEVGVGVPDVATAVAELGSVVGLAPYPPQEEVFAPVGDPDGMLIVVQEDRHWFPLREEPSARGPLEVTVRRRPGARPGVVRLGAASVLRSR